jgi:hypothetical protein
MLMQNGASGNGYPLAKPMQIQKSIGENGQTLGSGQTQMPNIGGKSPMDHHRPQAQTKESGKPTKPI